MDRDAELDIIRRAYAKQIMAHGAPNGHRWDSSPKIRFAADSALERDGFEPLVPPWKGTASFETTLIDLRLPLLPENRVTPSREGPRVRIPLAPPVSLFRRVYFAAAPADPKSRLVCDHVRSSSRAL
jgi:hypothetical protein